MSLMRRSWHLEWVRYTTVYPLKCLVSLSNHRQMDFSQKQKKEIYRFVKNNIYSFKGNKILTNWEEFAWTFLNLNLYTSITFIKSSFWIRYKRRYIKKTDTCQEIGLFRLCSLVHTIPDKYSFFFCFSGAPSHGPGSAMVGAMAEQHHDT